jgi:integrase
MLDYMRTRMEQDKVCSATVNRESSFIRGMLSRAVEWDILGSNPLRGLRLFKEAGKRNVSLSPEQAAQLIEKLPYPIGDIVEFAIYTGFRRENILSLRLEQIKLYEKLSGGEVSLVLKGGRAETFPVGPQAAEIIQKHADSRNTGFVFTSPKTGSRYKDIHRTFDRAVNKLKLKVDGTKLRFHDLRHVFATWLHQSGVTLDTLRPLLGHQSRNTTDRYATFDRMDAGKVLSILPRIRKIG